MDLRIVFRVSEITLVLILLRNSSKVREIESIFLNPNFFYSLNGTKCVDRYRLEPEVG